MRLMNLGSLEKLVSSILLKFLNLTNFFTPPSPPPQKAAPPNSPSSPSLLRVLKIIPAIFWALVCGGCADYREIATACDQASQ